MAQTFRHSAEAMNFARQHHLPHAEVVLTFDESSYAVALPLPGDVAEPHTVRPPRE